MKQTRKPRILVDGKWEAARMGDEACLELKALHDSRAKGWVYVEIIDKVNKKSDILKFLAREEK